MERSMPLEQRRTAEAAGRAIDLIFAAERLANHKARSARALVRLGLPERSLTLGREAWLLNDAYRVAQNRAHSIGSGRVARSAATLQGLADHVAIMTLLALS